MLMGCLLGFFDGDGVVSYVGVFVLCGDEEDFYCGVLVF